MKNLFYLIFPLTLLLGCGEGNEPGIPSDNFDRQAMLRHWADNYIIPGYRALDASITELETATIAFTNNPNAVSLEVVQTQWLEAYQIWQRVSMLEVGRAAELDFRNQLNVYPIDVTGLRANLLAETTNFELPSNLDKQGFGALDYLLYGLADTPEATASIYADDPDAAKYRAYLLACVQRMGTLTDEVLSDWENGYRETFIANDGSSANASVDQFTNAFVFYYEKALRAGKVGIPAGVFSGSPLASHVEAPYYGQNRQFLATALNAFADFFNGASFEGAISGPSYYQYIQELQAAKEGTNLAQLIDEQFTGIRIGITGLDEQLASQVTNDNQAMLATYDELQRNVVLLKVDMMQALSIAVSYVDADGD